MVTVCGGFLIILGLVPKVGAVVADLPAPVIGGAATVMFAMVTAIGIRTLNKASFDGNHNLLIAAVSLSAGLIPAIEPSFYQQPLEAVPPRARGSARDRPGARRHRTRPRSGGQLVRRAIRRAK